MDERDSLVRMHVSSPSAGRSRCSVADIILESYCWKTEVHVLREKLLDARERLATAGSAAAKAVAEMEGLGVGLQAEREDAGFEIRHLEIDRQQAETRVARLEARLALVMHK